MSKNNLKYLAIIAMTLDHVTVLIPDMIIMNYIFHFIGRITAPLMCFFICEGYHHTSNLNMYALRLMLFSLISWIPYSIFKYELITIEFSIITNLLLGLMMIYVFDHEKEILNKIIYMLVFLALSIYCDWFLFVPSWILIFHVYRKDVHKRNVAYTIISIFYCLFVIINGNGLTELLWAGGVFVVPFILTLYDEKKASNSKYKISVYNKWFFYIYYPLHLMIFQLLK